MITKVEMLIDKGLAPRNSNNYDKTMNKIQEQKQINNNLFFF